jgi:hypothetical protein
MNMNSNRIDKSIEIGSWISSQYVSLGVSGNGRAELAAACYHITCQHQIAIAHLCRLGLFAPAKALVRCTWESFTRGLWLERSATVPQLDVFRKNGSLPIIKDLLIAIDKNFPNDIRSYLKIHETTYKQLCDFNHTGIGQISNHLIAGEIVAQLSDSEIDRVLRFVEGLAYSALHYMAELGNNRSVSQAVLNRMLEMNLRLEK